MSNEINNDKTEEQKSVVRLAYLALCLRNNDVSPEGLVGEVLRIESMTKDNSLAMMVQNAVRIRAKVVSVKFEQSSQRYLISYIASNNGTGEIETIRSERIDGPHGKIAERIWSGIHEDDEVVIFKKNEVANDNGRNASNGYRVAPWVVVVGKGGKK